MSPYNQIPSNSPYLHKNSNQLLNLESLGAPLAYLTTQMAALYTKTLLDSSTVISTKQAAVIRSKTIKTSNLTSVPQSCRAIYLIEKTAKNHLSHRPANSHFGTKQTENKKSMKIYQRVKIRCLGAWCKLSNRSKNLQTFKDFMRYPLKPLSNKLNNKRGKSCSHSNGKTSRQARRNLGKCSCLLKSYSVNAKTTQQTNSELEILSVGYAF